MAKGDSPKSVSISVDQLEERANRIREIDSKISAAGGNETQARKAVVDELISKNAEQVNGLYSQVIDQFKSLDGEVLVGLVGKLEEAFKGDLKGLVDGVVNEKVQGIMANSQVDVGALKEQRKAEADLFRALKTMLDSLGLDTSAVEEPKRSGGGRPAGSGGGTPKSGMNKEGYRYLMDGNPRPRSQNSFSSLAFYATKGLFMVGNDVSTLELKDGEKLGAPQLREYIKAQGINFGADDEWTLTLPNKTVISARRLTEQDKIDLGADETPAATNGAEAPVETATEPETATV